MVGEYGGIGWAAPGHEWLPGMCQHRSAGNFNTSSAGAAVLLKELDTALEGSDLFFIIKNDEFCIINDEFYTNLCTGKQAGNISSIVYTQVSCRKR